MLTRSHMALKGLLSTAVHVDNRYFVCFVYLMCWSPITKCVIVFYFVVNYKENPEICAITMCKLHPVWSIPHKKESVISVGQVTLIIIVMRSILVLVCTTLFLNTILTYFLKLLLTKCIWQRSKEGPSRYEFCVGGQ